MTDQPNDQPLDTQPVDAERVDPEHARSERAAESPPQDDAEEMEWALREGGPLIPDDPEDEESRREAPTEPGPGTSLT